MLSSSSNRQYHSVEPMSFSESSNHNPMMNRFAIKSNNVILEDYYEPTEAILLIEDEKIKEVIIPKDVDPKTLNQIYEIWNVQDHGNLYIFPGLVDSNVHLHSDFEEEWENVSYSTELAAAGGVTMIVDNPVMNKIYNSGEEYIASLRERIGKLKANSKVDFGIFAMLEPKTKNVIDKMLETGVIGLKCYLLNCFQESLGHFSSEMFPQVLKDLENYSNLFLMVHPEVATERELYISSPCRAVAIETRLDMKHIIKSIELGGAANKGSYLDELCKKSCNDDDDDDDDCPTAKLDTPTKLRSKVMKTKEKTEINDIVHFELLSYGYNNPKNEIVGGGDSSDSDVEIIKKSKTEQLQVLPIHTESIEAYGDNQENESMSLEERNKEDNIRSQAWNEEPKSREVVKVNIPDFNNIRLESSIPNSSNKKSRFARSSNQAVEIVKESDYDFGKDACTDATSNSQSKRTSPEKELNPDGNLDSSKSTKEGSFVYPKPIQISGLKSKPHIQRPLQTMGNLKISPSGHDPNKALTQTRKMLSFFTASDVKETYEKSNTSSPSPITSLGVSTTQNKENLNHSGESNQSKTFFPLSYIKETPSSTSSQFSSSLQKTEALTSATNLSPALSTKPMTPASSSLLLRRISRKPLHGITLPSASFLSSPSSDFTKVNSLAVLKSPRGAAKKEAKYNQNYRIFLANRPQNWEENAVTLVLSSIHPKTNLRILFPNLSLASSFLKIRQKKKSDEAFLEKIYSDTSAAHLFFNEKMIKNGETKYKVSPPFRNKENRRLLVENLRLGGIDVMSSYHFYVPPRFKQIDDGNFRRAFGGISSIGCSLQGAWTAVYSYQVKTNKKFNEDLIYQKKITNHILRQIYKTMSYNPAKMLKISNRKGTIAKGKDADFVIWDPYKANNNRALDINHIFAGKTILGTVYKTYLRGNLIFDLENGGVLNRDCPAEFIRP